MKLSSSLTFAMLGLAACNNDLDRDSGLDSGIQIEDSGLTEAQRAYECQQALAGAEALPNFSLALLAVDGQDEDPLNHGEDSAYFEAVINGDPSITPGCIVLPGNGIGNGWFAEVSRNDLTGQPDTLTVSFPWDEEAVPAVEVWCMPNPEECSTNIMFTEPGSSTPVDHLSFESEQ